jgi:hypothetical protein
MEHAGFITMAKAQFASNLPRIEMPKKPKQKTFMGSTIMAVKPVHMPCPCMSEHALFYLIFSSSKDHRSFTFPKKICFA